MHPISPLTTTLTFGPISAEGNVVIKLIYDHRVLDGAYIARRLSDIETVLNGVILDELRSSNKPETHARADLAAPATPKPHAQAQAFRSDSVES